MSAGDRGEGSEFWRVRKNRQRERSEDVNRVTIKEGNMLLWVEVTLIHLITKFNTDL